MYDLSKLKDVDLVDRINNLTVLIDLVKNYKEAHLDASKPHLPIQLANEMLSINSYLIDDYTYVIGKLNFYYAQIKTARDFRYNSCFVSYKKDTEQKNTDAVAKALSENVVINEGFDEKLSGILSWRKRLEVFYDRACEQINIAKKVYEKSAL